MWKHVKWLNAEGRKQQKRRQGKEKKVVFGFVIRVVVSLLQTRSS